MSTLTVQTRNLQSAGRRQLGKRSAPSLPTEKSDAFTPQSSQNEPLMASPKWAQARTDENKAKLTGGQTAALILGLTASVASLLGVAVSGMGPSSEPVAPTPETEVVTETEVEVQTPEAAAEISLVEEKEEKSFSDGRELLLDRSEIVHSGQFNPDPAYAVDSRANNLIFEEAYIADLVDRDLTTVPEGTPRFTALDVDSNQGSKLYFNSDLEEVGWGYGMEKSDPFFTRPTRMNGRGAGIRDQIGQYQLSCVYRLEEDATLHGVDLEAGLYRLITLDPSSNVATPSMQRSVCPGHKLVPTGSGISGDYVPTQQSESGEALRVNPDDIVQVWTLTPEEAAEYGK